MSKYDSINHRFSWLSIANTKTWVDKKVLAHLPAIAIRRSVTAAMFIKSNTLIKELQYGDDEKTTEMGAIACDTAISLNDVPFVAPSTMKLVGNLTANLNEF